MKHQLERYGLGYRRTFDGGVVMTANRLRESRGETSCELAVVMHWPHGPEDPIARFRFNLSSLTARKTTAAYLNQKVEEIHWVGLLEILCREILDAEHTPPKVEIVGSGERSPEAGTLLGPMCPVGEVSLLYARASTGKSTVAAGLLYSVQSGIEVIPGWQPTYTAPGLVIDFEGRARTWDHRLRWIAAGADGPEIGIHYMRLRGQLRDYVEEVAAVVTDLGIGFVIVDGTERAIGAGSGDGDTFKDRAQRLFDAVERLETTVLLIDHLTGQDAREDDDEAEPYGSVFKGNWARQHWRLKRQRDPTNGRAELLLRCRKYNDGVLPSAVSLAAVYTPDSIRFEAMQAAEAPELVRAALSQPEQARRILARGARKTAEIAEEMGISTNQTRVVLGRLAQHNEVTKMPGDMWGLALGVEVQ